ncbi:16S rRNA (adenine(1518)-N(6)/adenine(1519)-N(6))-dimethyltransferase RsmA [Aureliella helgolandensis]|uniref:Ribosomal RNA small subunit methyltransferase A n=1 Tax=Aureliella helgolandensis TaxID=2527968 RepID=A0A518GDB6_9BACT|nr:16S rRNA (adenine(1518)-N(6)/adenine(1519)-N(6))-dimethyltransferase RsmA [Aureliella helgolandensis]QDV26594.1 Ribosomal RNA adenine dimethylase [Aureliella helgolandensis]
MSERQTLSYLQQRFASSRIQPQTRFGQNFLIDLNLVNLIASTAELGPRDVVLEVGTGMGSLTTIMAAEAGHVVTVEIDHYLAPLAREEFETLDNVTLLEQDALKSKNKLHPQVIETLREKVAQIPGGRIKLVANLPYNVATPIISNLLDMDPWPVRMVTTIQRELAERIVARPRTKDYSALTVWIQAQCQAEIVRIMPPSVFWPPPKVESAILDIRPQKVMRKRIVDPAHFHSLVRGIFIHRRKFLRSALFSAVKDVLTKPEVDQVLAQMELDANTRAEQLTPQQLLDLTDLVRLMAAEKASTPTVEDR